MGACFAMLNSIAPGAKTAPGSPLTPKPLVPSLPVRQAEAEAPGSPLAFVANSRCEDPRPGPNSIAPASACTLLVMERSDIASRSAGHAADGPCTYSYTADELVCRREEVGNRPLPASVALRTPFLASAAQRTPSLASAVGTPAADLRAPSLAALVRHADHAVYMNMLRHINVAYGAWPLETWEARFGRVSRAQPYGDRFWPGFMDYVQRQYLPTSRAWHVGSWADLQAKIFALPLDGSKSAAHRPRGDENPASGAVYPCMAAREAPGSGHFIMICVHIAIAHVQKPWAVHESWLSTA